MSPECSLSYRPPQYPNKDNFYVNIYSDNFCEIDLRALKMTATLSPTNRLYYPQLSTHTDTDIHTTNITGLLADDFFPLNC